MTPTTTEESVAEITPSNEILLQLADSYPAPQEWYDE